MKFTRVLLAALFCGALVLAPTLADARAGGGKSMGSRGYNTYQQTPAKPLDRSVTQPRTTQPSAVQPGTAAGSGMMGRSPFMTGLMGGLLGAGLMGLLFSNSAWASEGSGAAGMLGMFLQFLLIGGAAYLGYVLLRRVFGGAPAMAGAGTQRAALGGAAMPHGDAAPSAGPEVTDQDRASFAALLTGIQAAWSEGDLAKLRALATPEMVSYFAEDMAETASSRVRNVVRDVELVKGDVVDHWVEGNRQYATAVMTWRAIDYKERDGQVIEGDPREPVEATEAWTFLRVRGGDWLLSAIQQV